MNVLNVTVYPDNDEPFTTTFPKLYGTGRIIVDFGDGSEWKSSDRLEIHGHHFWKKQHVLLPVFLHNIVQQCEPGVNRYSPKSGSQDSDDTGPVSIGLNDDQDNDQTPFGNIHQI